MTDLPLPARPRGVVSRSWFARAAAAACGGRVFVAMALLGFLAAPASSQERQPSMESGVAPAFGPLRVAERNPLFRLFLTPVTEGADLLAPGRLGAHLSFSYSNIFELGASETHDILFDLERLTSAMTLRYGLARQWEVGVTVATQTNWGGFLDPFVQGVHRTFGLPNADRDKVPDGDYQVRVQERRSSRALVSLPSGTLLEDPRLHVVRRLSGGPGESGAWSLRGTVKVPAGAPAAGTGRVGGAVELAGRRSWGPTHLHLQAGIVALGVPPELERHVRETAATLAVGAERQVADGLALQAQILGGTPYGRNFGAVELDGFPLNLVVGATGVAGGGWGWQVSFAEDLQPEGPSVDFTLDLQLSRRW